MELGWLGYLLHILRLPVTPHEIWYTFFILVIYFFISDLVLIPVCHPWALKEKVCGQ